MDFYSPICRQLKDICILKEFLGKHKISRAVEFRDREWTFQSRIMVSNTKAGNWIIMCFLIICVFKFCLHSNYIVDFLDFLKCSNFLATWTYGSFTVFIVPSIMNGLYTPSYLFFSLLFCFMPFLFPFLIWHILVGSIDSTLHLLSQAYLSISQPDLFL